ncbi:MAG: hypothetical protein QOF83_4045 [Solirubrobacteraceae bacterium]|jgi:hypothetical protein|nr:hypothetical protein [Solirubrobacteraceae bacterium]
MYERPVAMGSFGGPGMVIWTLLTQRLRLMPRAAPGRGPTSEVVDRGHGRIPAQTGAEVQGHADVAGRSAPARDRSRGMRSPTVATRPGAPWHHWTRTVACGGRGSPSEGGCPAGAIGDLADLLVPDSSLEPCSFAEASLRAGRRSGHPRRGRVRVGGVGAAGNRRLAVACSRLDRTLCTDPGLPGNG